MQYADYAVWQRERLDGAALERELACWRERLDGAATLALPTDRPHPRGAELPRRHAPLRAPARSWAGRCSALARAQGATPFMVLLAAFDALLRRWSGTEDVVVGSPVAGRTPERDGAADRRLPQHPGAAHRPLRRPHLRAGCWRRVREATLDAYAHQEVPFERLVEELKIERTLEPRTRSSR